MKSFHSSLIHHNLTNFRFKQITDFSDQCLSAPTDGFDQLSAIFALKLDL